MELETITAKTAVQQFPAQSGSSLKKWVIPLRISFLEFLAQQ